MLDKDIIMFGLGAITIIIILIVVLTCFITVITTCSAIKNYFKYAEPEIYAEIVKKVDAVLKNDEEIIRIARENAGDVKEIKKQLTAYYSQILTKDYLQACIKGQSDQFHNDLATLSMALSKGSSKNAEGSNQNVKKPSQSAGGSNPKAEKPSESAEESGPIAEKPNHNADESSQNVKKPSQSADGSNQKAEGSSKKAEESDPKAEKPSQNADGSNPKAKGSSEEFKRNGDEIEDEAYQVLRDVRDILGEAKGVDDVAFVKEKLADAYEIANQFLNKFKIFVQTEDETIQNKAYQVLRDVRDILGEARGVNDVAFIKEKWVDAHKTANEFLNKSNQIFLQGRK